MGPSRGGGVGLRKEVSGQGEGVDGWDGVVGWKRNLNLALYQVGLCETLTIIQGWVYII